MLSATVGIYSSGVIMNTFNFNILSLNVRGLREYKKNRKLFNWIVKHKGDRGITFLQETHSTPDIEDDWSRRTKGELVMSHGSSNSKGAAILFGEKLNFAIKQSIIDKNGRYVIILSEIQGTSFMLVNTYAPNDEKSQVTLIEDIVEKMNTIDCPVETYTIWGGDFNFIFDLDLEASGGNPNLKLRSIETMKTIMNDLDLCDIWRIRNPTTKRFTWRGTAQGKNSNHNHYLHRRLDFFFISDELQPFVEDCDIIPAPSTDHSALSINLKAFQEESKGPSFWKFNNSLAENEEYITKLKTTIDAIKKSLNSENILNSQVRWELIKYEVRKFTITFSKSLAKKRRTEYQKLESEIKQIENTNGWEKEENMIVEHDKLIKLLEERSNYITEGIIIRSKAKWYELGEKSNKYFLTLEKRNKAKTHIKKIVEPNNTEITQPKKILGKIYDHFSKIYLSRSDKTENECLEFLSQIDIPKLSEEDKEACDGEITIDECHYALKQMGTSKTPGNDGLTKEFYMCMWSELKDDLVRCLNDGYKNGSLTTSQKQIVITLLEKPGKDNRLLDSWRPISLINVDVKICSKVLSNRITELLPSIIHPDQAAFIKNRTIDEPIRLIDDIMDYARKENISLILFAADFEKAFDTIEHNFVYGVLKGFGFGEGFIKWIKILLENNQSCVMNNGLATNFFPVFRGTKQGDPISPYIFILVIEIMALMMRKCKDIEGIKIKNKHIKLVLFADDTTFFLKDINSLDIVLNQLEMYKQFSSLKINLTKSEAGWIGRNKDESEQNIKWINFYEKGIKILGIFFSYNKILHYNNNFKRILTEFKTTLSLWRTRTLTLYGKIQVVRSLALSKLLYVCSKIHVNDEFIKLVESNIKDFIWNGKKPKIKYRTLIGEYTDGGLKLPDFCSCIKANRIKLAINLMISEERTWNTIPLLYLDSIGGVESIRNNFDKKRIPDSIPIIYKIALLSWAEISSIIVDNNPDLILEQHLWNNKHIKIQSKAVFFKTFFELNINRVVDLCNEQYEFKWEHVRSMGLQDNDFMRWAGIVHAIPSEWKTALKNNDNTFKNEGLARRYLYLGNKKIDLTKSNTKLIYQWLVSKKFKVPTSQSHICKRIGDDTPLEWEVIYGRIYKTTIDSYCRFFQYKILNNCLYLNKDLNRFKLIEYSSCSFCSLYPETIDHLFVECIDSKNYYLEIRSWLEKYNITLPESNRSNIILGIEENVSNYVILMYKLTIYKAREKGKVPSLSLFKNFLVYSEKIEYMVAMAKNKLFSHIKKWEKLKTALESE